MRVIIYDTDSHALASRAKAGDHLIFANGKYAPCQGCFGCWTKHPAECFMNDSLKDVCRILGRADELIIITQNYYGSYSPPIKKILDRGIGISTPLSTYRGRQMHHTLRYGTHNLLKVYVYGEINEEEKSTFQLLAERNALNNGFQKAEVLFLQSIDRLDEVAL